MAHYETTDIFKGAFFLSSGGNLSGISFNDRQIATFTLTGKNLQQLDSDYHTGRKGVKSAFGFLVFSLLKTRRYDEVKAVSCGSSAFAV